MKAAVRERDTFRCAECGWLTAKWVGRCGECQAWGTVADTTAPAVRTTRAGPVSSAARPIGEVDVESARAVPTGVDELDRVLGGGMVPGAVVLMAGEPGVGKSTLLLDVAAREGRSPPQPGPVVFGPLRTRSHVHRIPHSHMASHLCA
jgi:DNA repair protein RadA/Sms